MRLATFVVVLVLASCNRPECDDPDLDGYGPHCSLGPDCDATNPTRNADCVAVPPPDCDANPEAPGCPCFAGSVARCFLDDPALEGVGRCTGGASACTNGTYGVCIGYVGPSIEACNGIDDDCDGDVDDGVQSPCGGCNTACSGEVWGPGGTEFHEDPGLATTDAGELELARTITARDGIFFVNTGEDTVSHLSASAITEVSRHASGGESPTRVAVDYFGDVFVTNEALAAQGTLTKLGGTLAGCVDRDVSGTIETSTGPTDVPAIAADECVVFSMDVGSVGEMPRAIAIDGSLPGGGDPWVGLHHGEAVLHVDGETGATIERVAIPGFRPFSAAFDGRGYLWLSSEDGELVRIDRRTSPPGVERSLMNLSCYVTHAIAIDRSGAVVATGQNCDDVYRFDPSTRRLTTIATLPSPRGIVFFEGIAHVAHTDGRVSLLGTSPLETTSTLDAWALGSMPRESIAIAVDADGATFVASAQGGPAGVGLATRFDASTHAVTHQIPLGLGPRGFGDGSGHALAGTFATSGSTSQVFRGCPSGTPTHWQRLHVDLDAGSSSGATIEVRWATDEASLATALYSAIGVYPGSTTPLETLLPEGGVIEIRLTLSSTARDSSPLVRRVGVETECVIEIE